MKKLLLMALPCLLMLSSCGSDDEQDSFMVDCTYLTVQNGTKFTYKQESNGVASTVTNEVTSQETVDGVLVASFENGSGQNAYITCEGDKIIQSAPPQTQTQGGTTQTTNALLMTLDLGGAINDTMNVMTINATVNSYGETLDLIYDYDGYVVQTGLTMEVEGTTYNNVVQYDMMTYYSIPDYEINDFPIVLTRYYIAPEVATIQAEYLEPNTMTALSKVTLVSYEF